MLYFALCVCVCILHYAGSISYGVDLAVLASCNHSIVDYGTFGLWAGLLAGGRHVLQLLWLLYCVLCRIVLPLGYSTMKSPDMMWWEQVTLLLSPPLS